MTKTLDHFLGLKYPVELREDPGAGWFARHPDLDGCMTVGDTAAEAVTNLDDARGLWIRTRFGRGLAVPKPAVAQGRSKRR